MAGMAVNRCKSLEWLELAEMPVNGCKCQEMAGMAEVGWT